MNAKTALCVDTERFGGTDITSAPTAVPRWTEVTAMRLIDGDTLWEKLDDEPWYDNADRDEIALPIVDASPTIDAVVVTRCKDCKYLRVWNQKDLYVFCPKTNFVFLPFQADTRTHFCSYGEPKET